VARLPVELDQQVLSAPGVPVGDPDHRAIDRRLQAHIDVAGLQLACQGLEVRRKYDRPAAGRVCPRCHRGLHRSRHPRPVATLILGNIRAHLRP
jgi:hypothetical protein